MKLNLLGKSFSVLFVFALLFTINAQAGSYESLTPLLKDLKGWEAEKAQGMNMDMGGMKMINATRNYKKGEKEINAVIMIGSQAMTQGKMQNMKYEDANTKMDLKEIEGFQAQLIYDKQKKTLTVVVFLAQNQTSGAMFTFSGKGFSEDKALELAKKFDWKKMKKAVLKQM